MCAQYRPGYMGAIPKHTTHTEIVGSYDTPILSVSYTSDYYRTWIRANNISNNNFGSSASDLCSLYLCDLRIFVMMTFKHQETTEHPFGQINRHAKTATPEQRFHNFANPMNHVDLCRSI